MACPRGRSGRGRRRRVRRIDRWKRRRRTRSAACARARARRARRSRLRSPGRERDRQGRPRRMARRLQGRRPSAVRGASGRPRERRRGQGALPASASPVGQVASGRAAGWRKSGVIGASRANQRILHRGSLARSRSGDTRMTGQRRFQRSRKDPPRWHGDTGAGRRKRRRGRAPAVAGRRGQAGDLAHTSSIHEPPSLCMRDLLPVHRVSAARPLPLRVFVSPSWNFLRVLTLASLLGWERRGAV